MTYWVTFVILLITAPAWAIEEFVTVPFHTGSIVDGDGRTQPVSHYGTLGLDIDVAGTATVTVQGRSTLGEGFKAVRCLNTADGTLASAYTADANVQCPIAGLAEIKTVVSGCSSCLVRSNGRLTTATISALTSGGGGSGGDGAILDGVSSSIKGTVFDRTNSNPIATQLVDSNGDPVSVGGGTQYGQGSATTDTDQLMMAGCVRADTAAVATGVIDGDRARCIVDSTGRLWVHVGVIDGTVAATQSGTWNIGSITTLPSIPTGANTIGGVNLSQYTPASGRLPVDGSGVTQPVSAASLPLPTGAATSANQDGIIRDGTGDTTQANVTSGRLNVDGSGVTQPVSGTVTVTATNLDVQIGGSDSLTIGTFPDNEPFNVAQMNGVAVTMGNGVSGTGVQRVTIASDSTGTVAVTQATASSLNAQVVGSVAHDAGDSGNPIKIGCHARTTNRTAVADADRADIICDDNGQLVTTPMAPRDRVVRSGVVTLTNTTETTLVAAGGAGVFRDLTYLKCTNNSATLVRVDLRDATAGTVIDSWALAASGGGFNLAWSVPYAQASSNNNWTVQLSGSVTDVRCSAQAVEKN